MFTSNKSKIPCAKDYAVVVRGIVTREVIRILPERSPKPVLNLEVRLLAQSGRLKEEE